MQTFCGFGRPNQLNQPRRPAQPAAGWGIFPALDWLGNLLLGVGTLGCRLSLKEAPWASEEKLGVKLSVGTLRRIPKIGVDRGQPLVRAGLRDCRLPKPPSSVQRWQGNT